MSNIQNAILHHLADARTLHAADCDSAIEVGQIIDALASTVRGHDKCGPCADGLPCPQIVAVAETLELVAVGELATEVRELVTAHTETEA